MLQGQEVVVVHHQGRRVVHIQDHLQGAILHQAGAVHLQGRVPANQEAPLEDTAVLLINLNP